MRKFLALIMVIAMIASFAVVASAEDTTKTVKFTFDADGEEGLEKVGEGFTYADGAVTITDAASYFKVTNLDLKGAIGLEVTAKVSYSDTAHTAWVMEATSEASHTYNDGKTETYVGLAVLSGSKVSSEVFVKTRPLADANGNKTPEVAVDLSAPLTLHAVYEANKTTLTINDGTPAVFERSDDFTVAAALGESPVLMIGHANWNSGEGANGLTIDEITITATYASGSTPADPGDDAPGTDAPAKTGAPKTGFATIALAVVAIGSGAYIVSKKH